MAWRLASIGPASLGRQLLLLVAVTAVPILLFSALMLYVVAGRERDAALQGLHERVTLIAATVDRELDRQIALLTALSASEGLARSDLGTFRAEAERVLAHDPGIRALIVIDSVTGRQVLNTAVAAGAELPMAVDPDNLRKVVESRTPAVLSRLGERAPASGVRLASVRVPVVRDGRVPYVLGTAIDVRIFQPMVALAALPPGWVAALIDRDHRLLARSRAAAEFVGQPATDDLVAAIAGRERGLFLARTKEGEPSYAAFARSPLSGWISVVGVPAAEIARIWQRQVWIVAAGGLLSVAIALGGASILARQIRRQRRLEEELRQAEYDGKRLAQAQRAAAEKDVLLREIHHRVKNNLQMIQSMVRLRAPGCAGEPCAFPRHRPADLGRRADPQPDL